MFVEFVTTNGYQEQVESALTNNKIQTTLLKDFLEKLKGKRIANNIGEVKDALEKLIINKLGETLWESSGLSIIKLPNKSNVFQLMIPGKRRKPLVVATFETKRRPG